ncbi:MAG: pyruvate carboxylase [Alphaproteobacteria bacterium]
MSKSIVLSPPFGALLIANRSEIAIRIQRAASELGIRTVAIYANEDKLSLHRFKADEAYLIGRGLGALEAYLSIDEILEVARRSGADAVHPGYGLLSERPDFAEAVLAAGMTFIGPSPRVMRLLGDKVAARGAAIAAGVGVIEASGVLAEDISEADLRRQAEALGYPLMLKASWGGGGRGMRRIDGTDELAAKVLAGRREAAAAFGDGSVYLERFIERARHVEVQLLGDSHGNLFHLYERDCSVQRRNQKIVERAPAPYLSQSERDELTGLALRLVRHTGYENAGTAEFLQDMDSGHFYFIEVNPRIQVEHTVTEEVTGIDIVKAQLKIAAGGRLGRVEETGVPPQEEIHLNGHALQCRLTTEDPLNKFIPDYGRITAYRGAMGFGIRLDGGTAYSGAVVTRHYDSLLEKVTAWAPSEAEGIDRMIRALREFRIRGVATNLHFLETLLKHPKFRACEYTTRFIDEHDELFEFEARRDRATRLLNYIADITVNGHPEVLGRPRPLRPVRLATGGGVSVELPVPREAPPDGSRQRLEALGAEGLARWVLEQPQVLLTDTTMRDAHQSLLATRMRSYDMLAAASAYAHALPQLFSVECWGGATFDVAFRFLQEDPWDRLRELRQRMPNLLLQMLLRGANGVGYTNYPDNVVRDFTLRAAEGGIDLFRVFDSLNWCENMRVAIDAVLESGKLCEAAICYTGNILDPARAKYNLDYYIALGRELQATGTHILGLKDMAGLLTPAAARILIPALKEETGLPLHFHTHDTSGGALATVLAAAEAGADIVDGAMDSMSGTTSQPCLGSIVETLRHTPLESGIDPGELRALSHYWEHIREGYVAFESHNKSPASEVYLHEMPGGQFTNLKEQARSMGLLDRWPEIARAYAQVNEMFGDIPKVTPSSKVVGDMALAMVAGGLSRAEVEDPEREVSFPDSVIGFFRGDLGQPPGGFPQGLQAKVLKGGAAMTERAGASLPPVNLETAREELSQALGGLAVWDTELASWLMYPQVYLDYRGRRRSYGPVHILPTGVFFYGMQVGEEISVDMERGKTLIISCQAVGETDDEGMVKIFFELNGQPRVIRVADRSASHSRLLRVKADAGNPLHVASPMPGMVVSLAVSVGQEVHRGDLLFTLSAMKMETSVHADRGGVVECLHVVAGDTVDAKDLLLEFTE